MERKTIFVAGLFIFATIAVLGLIMMPENTGKWVCENGEWIAKGEVKTEKPSYGCDLEEVVEKCDKWLADYNECEYVSKEWCDREGGEFSECESACRHKAPGTICTMQCVPVCKFSQKEEVKEAINNPKNLTYIIDNKEVKLTNGYSEEEILPGSASKIITKVFGVDFNYDVDKDGDIDTLLILTQNTGGTGVFFYVVAAINEGDHYRGTNGIFIGDRISPELINPENGDFAFNYSDRHPWESFAEKPTVGKTRYFTYENNRLVKSRRELIFPEEEAYQLVFDRWGDCNGECELSVKIISGKDNVWYVEGIQDGLKDDSIKTIKRTMYAHNVNGKWMLGNYVKTEYICQEGRGQSEFDSYPCE